ARFAEAFAEVLREPQARFGALEIKRLPGREGLPFVVGERFTGCVKLPHIGKLGAWLEDAMFSDYAEIVELAPRRVVYRYLSGCPIAGSSTFTVEPLASDRCRFRVVFEYQELSGLAISILHRFGLRMHDQVTRLQAERAAAKLGASIVASTI